MEDEKKIPSPEPSVTELKSEPPIELTKQDTSPMKDEIKADSTVSTTVSGIVSSSSKDETDARELGAQNLPISCYNYYYPGSNVAFAPPNENGQFGVDDTLKGSQSDNGPYMYYMPGYNPYATGPMLGFSVPQAYFTSSFGSEAVPGYSWDSQCLSDLPSGSSVKSGNAEPVPTATKLDGSNSLRINGNGANKLSMPTLPSKENYPAAAFSSFTNQSRGLSPHNGSMNRRPNVRVWDNNRYEKPDRNGEFDSLVELTCGPRARTKIAASDSSAEKEEVVLSMTFRKDRVNVPDFETVYENAKFYVIKSYSEDDIHKSVKYSVWSSTPNGNKKLDAAFREAEATASSSGKKCPVFLFFSVNGSGQFVGLAEMIGRVDFNKDMDFWQVDKWNGFFLVRWHVIKDIPNRELRHIILEYNENKPVTHTRDTQEIKLKEGLIMLNIFKNFSAKSSLLDDYNFYEERQKSLEAKKMKKAATLRMEFSNNADFDMEPEGMETNRNFAWTRRNGNPASSSSLINLTKNLSLRGCTTKTRGGYNPRQNSGV